MTKIQRILSALLTISLASTICYAQPTPPSNPLRIGNTVIGGTSQSVLYVDSSGKLAQDNPYLIYDPVQNWLTISGNSAYEGLISVGKILTRSPDGTTSPIYMLTRDDPYSGDATYGGIFGVYDEATTLIAGISDSGGFKFGPNYTSTSSTNTFEQSTVFNEAGSAVNFRVESDTNVNMLYVNGASNGVVVGGTSVLGSSALTLNGDMYVAPAFNNKINFDRTDTASFGRLLYLNAGTEMYGLGMRGDDTVNNSLSLTGNSPTFPRILTVAPGTPQTVFIGGKSATDAGAYVDTNGGAVFNEQGTATADFRIETDALANAFFVDASANFIGFGTNSPAYGVEFVVAQGGAPYYANVGFRPTGSNQDMALEIESTRNATTQRWFFGTGSGGSPNTNNFRIYDLNNLTEAINIIPGASPTVLLKGDQTTNARIILGTSASTPTVFNEQGDAQAFRIEGDTKSHLFYVGGDAGDIVGINANSTEISAGGGSVLTVKSDANGGFTNVFGAIAPSTTAGNRACFNVGVTNSSNDLNSFCFKYVGAGNTTNAFETFFSFSPTPAMRVLANNKGGIGIGSSDPSAVWHVIGTAEQERLGYDGSNYVSTTVGSTGGVTFDAVGSGSKFTFSDQLIGKGTATNDSAAAGNIGEYSSSYIATGSSVTLTTATGANVTSLSLTAGDWDCEGNVNYDETTASVTITQGGITSTSATIPTDGSEVHSGLQTAVVTDIDSVTVPRKRFSLSGTTTVYLVAKVTFAAGTVKAYGGLTCRRMR